MLTSCTIEADPILLQIMNTARELTQTVPARREGIRCAATAALDRGVVIDLDGCYYVMLL